MLVKVLIGILTKMNIFAEIHRILERGVLGQAS